MKELIIHHIPAHDSKHARVRVHYRAEAGAQALEHETDFRFAISDEERRLIQWYLEDYLIYPWGEFRNRAQQVEELMARLGAELFCAVFGEHESAALYAHVADDLPNTRVVIHASNSEGIALPWEMLRDPARGEHSDLARLAYAFVRRQQDFIFEPSPTPGGDSFNILMVICRPDGPEGDIPFQSVARPLLELFRQHRDRIHLDILRPPTFERLARVLADRPNFYHVLHFDGHGTFPQGGRLFYEITGAQGQLSFEDGEVSGDALGGVLVGRHIPIVLLNACQSGMTHPESLYPSVGNQLLKYGVRGVVAMAYSVYVQTAVRFMARLYEGLMSGEELSRAVRLAREELCAHPQRTSPIGEIELRDWVVPVMFEAAPARLEGWCQPIRFDLGLLHDQQAKVSTEINCPDPPILGFVGRDGMTLELERAFQNETIVLLDGMAGVGKTEMAMGFARWRAETGSLDGPTFFFQFEHYTPLARVLRSVGEVFASAVQQMAGKDWHLCDAGEQRQVAVAILRQVPCLMIWDNFEPVAGFPTGTESAWKINEQKELRDFLFGLHGGKTKVIITSRRDEKWLGEIYRLINIDGLDLIEAHELAICVLQHSGLSVEKIRSLPQYNDLLKYLQGNPLAIQVILPALKDTTPDGLLNALQTGEAELSADEPSQGRERSLVASLNYRLDMLSPTLWKRLSILGLFHSVVGADLLEWMSQVEDAPDLIKCLSQNDWIQTLDSGKEIGLVHQFAEGLYDVHPALIWFFQTKLRQAFPEHIGWLEQAFCKLFRASGNQLSKAFQTNPEDAISAAAAHEYNFARAVDLATRNGFWDEIMGVMYGLRILLVTQARWVEWEQYLDRLEAYAIDEEEEPIAGRERLWIGLLGFRFEVSWHHRDFEQMKRIADRQRYYFQQEGDMANLAVVLHQLGMVAEEQRQFDEAEKWYHESLAIKENEDEYERALTVMRLGMIAHAKGLYDDAEGYYRQSLEMSKRIGDMQGQAHSLNQLGAIASDRGKLDEAERLYNQSLEMHRRLGDKAAQASTLNNLGLLASSEGRFDDAERYHRQSLAIEENIGNALGQAQTLHNLGVIAQRRDHVDEAERWYRQSLAIEESIGDQRGKGRTLTHLAQVALRKDQLDDAEKIYQQALLIFESISDEHGRGAALYGLGNVAFKRRDADTAKEKYQQSLRIAESIKDLQTQANSLYGLGTIAEVSHRSFMAMRYYEQSKSLFQTLADSSGLAMVNEALTRVKGW